MTDVVRPPWDDDTSSTRLQHESLASKSWKQFRRHPGAIAGTVWDEDYNPVSGAMVTLDGAGASPSTTTTQINGKYYFTSVSSDNHQVTADHGDYVSDSQEVEVGTNVTASLSFNLKASP